MRLMTGAGLFGESVAVEALSMAGKGDMGYRVDGRDRQLNREM